MASIHTVRDGDLVDLTVDNEVPLEASNDAFSVRGSNNILLNCQTIDTRCRVSSHCDHVHLIPQGKEPNAQYFGAIGYNNQIIGGGLESNGSMQGIFSSDGCQSNLFISDQVITTESEHEISINGLLSGTFQNNKNSNGEPLKINLEPLRIGGGLPDAFYVLSFKDHEYGDIVSDQPIIDNRSKPLERYPNARYVHNFDLNLYREISESLADRYTSLVQHFSEVNNLYFSESQELSAPGYIKGKYIIIENYLLMNDEDTKYWFKYWPNFKPSELASRDYSVKIYIPALDSLQALRTEYGKPLYINSAWRNTEHNNLVGGRKNSDHTWIEGRDINSSAFDTGFKETEEGVEIESLAIKHGFNAIGRYPLSKFIHISMREPKSNRNIYQWGSW